MQDCVRSNNFKLSNYSSDAQIIIKKHMAHFLELCGVYEGGDYIHELIIAGVDKKLNIIIIYTYMYSCNSISDKSNYILVNEISLKDELYKLFVIGKYKRLPDESISLDPYYYSDSYPLMYFTFTDNYTFRNFIKNF